MTASPTTAYPRSDYLTEPEWLAAHLGDPDLCIIDCDMQEIANARPHIPGAVSVPIHPYMRDIATNKGVLPPDQAQELFSTLGINSTSRVICYDSQGGVLAARAWWVLWYYGHSNVAVLNGGLTAWTTAGFPTCNTWETPAPGDFVPHANPEYITSCDLMLPHVGSDAFIPLDMRSDLEWLGTPLRQHNEHEGRIPGAVHIEWRNFVDWNNGTRLKSPQAIDDLLRGYGVMRDKRVVPY